MTLEMSNLEKEIRNKIEHINYEIDSIKIKITKLIKIEGGELITRKKHTSYYNNLEQLMYERRTLKQKLEDLN